MRLITLALIGGAYYLYKKSHAVQSAADQTAQAITTEVQSIAAVLAPEPVTPNNFTWLPAMTSAGGKWVYTSGH